ncbi:hypothetical protein FACS1894152_8540 [Bacilli bacterium]|nr:hypothetical protein FACS1894152_8540 [Bacilli bacterium]
MTNELRKTSLKIEEDKFDGRVAYRVIEYFDEVDGEYKKAVAHINLSGDEIISPKFYKFVEEKFGVATDIVDIRGSEKQFDELQKGIDKCGGLTEFLERNFDDKKVDVSMSMTPKGYNEHCIVEQQIGSSTKWQDSIKKRGSITGVSSQSIK